MEPDASMETTEGKRCEQCEQWKPLSAFHRRKNKTDGRMRICADCYTANLQETYRRQREWEAERKRQEEERRQRMEAEIQRREEERRQVEEERRREQDAWLALQQDRQCSACQQVLPATAFLCLRSRRGEYSLHDQCTNCVEEERRRQEEERHRQGEVKKKCEDCHQMFSTDKDGGLRIPYFEMHSTLCPTCQKPLQIEWHDDGGFVAFCPGHKAIASTSGYAIGTLKRCPRCHEEQRKKNRQANPLCPMCGMPTHASGFLKEYRGYSLDIIRVCCKACTPRFNTLPESEQLRRLRNAMKNAYGDYATIYALHYDASDTVHHIGRTKRLARRMTEYRRRWDVPIHHRSVLEEVTPGGLSMERESRWMMHAIKYGWPIDNFNLLKGGEDGLGGQRAQAALTKAVADIEPLTAPFEVIEPLLCHFLGTLDARIVNWLVHHAPATPM
jgi:hypothetical protein